MTNGDLGLHHSVRKIPDPSPEQLSVHSLQSRLKQGDRNLYAEVIGKDTTKTQVLNSSGLGRWLHTLRSFCPEYSRREAVATCVALVASLPITGVPLMHQSISLTLPPSSLVLHACMSIQGSTSTASHRLRTVPCPCGVPVQTVAHVLLDCPLAVDVWREEQIPTINDRGDLSQLVNTCMGQQATVTFMMRTLAFTARYYPRVADDMGEISHASSSFSRSVTVSCSLSP